MKRTLCISMLLLFASLGRTQPQPQESEPGQVQLPLEIYNQLIEASRNPVQPDRPAPVNHALGNAQVNLRVATTEPRASGEVSVTLSIQVFEDQWSLVPVLPVGTPVSTATIQGQPVQLVSTPLGLAWTTNQKGSYTMQLSYRIDAAVTEGGYVLAVPLPQAAATNLSANLPGTGLDIAVIPAAGVRTTPSGSTTNVQATIPTTSGVQLSWRSPSGRDPSFSRANYQGELVGDAVSWSGDFTVELFHDETVTLPILPRSITLTNLQVDGKDAPILVEGKRFATIVRGQGTHRIQVRFQTPVVQKDGPPRVDLEIPRVPVSRFDLRLPGRKELAASPAASVTHRLRNGRTEATVHVPLTSSVSLTWSEAVPEAARREVRANATIYHAIHAEEGVLYVRARVHYDVRRGETNRIELALPADVQINSVTAESGAIADWRVEGSGNDRVLRVFLDRQIKGELLFDVTYDRSLAPQGETEALPLLSATGVGRQRGMVALLSSRDLTLNPPDDAPATRVGENQLPSFVRDDIEMTIAHTFKYSDDPPALTAVAATPERVAGKFDAQVDTLVSLGEVTVTGTASVEIRVKSGGLDELSLTLPQGTNLLNLSAPSLRTHRVSDDDQPVATLEFTQQMEGQFRVELSYERILDEDESDIAASTLRVQGADVEQGRIAVEALSAVEIQPAATDELSPIEVSELPRQLVLQTTNPILLAFKYARAEPEPRLALRVTRHALVDVQEAAIDRAEYRTLFTRDGLSVTTVHFTVRNSRKQFLRVELPESSDVWSVFVAGRPEKPALEQAEDGSEGTSNSILIKIVNATDGFPVDLIYATRGSAIGGLGAVRAQLPRPDILVTQSRWDIFLPDGMRYSTPSTNMDLVALGGRVSGEDMKAELARLADSGVSQNIIEPLRITVPSTGVHYGFEKLYANQANVEARVAIPYASRTGAALGQLASLMGISMLWLGAVLLAVRSTRIARSAQIALTGFGALVLLVALFVYNVSAGPALVISLLFGLSAAFVKARPWLEQLRKAQEATKTAEQNG